METRGAQMHADPAFAFFQALVDARVEVVSVSDTGTRVTRIDAECYLIQYSPAGAVQPAVIIKPQSFRAVVMKAVLCMFLAVSRLNFTDYHYRVP